MGSPGEGPGAGGETARTEDGPQDADAMLMTWLIAGIVAGAVARLVLSGALLAYRAATERRTS